MKECSWKGCSEVSFIKVGSGAYCKFHYKCNSMMASSNNNPNYPSTTMGVMNKMLRECYDKGLKCPHCEKQMLLHSSEGSRKDVVSIQHNLDGSLQLLCLSCNTSHGNYRSDAIFYKMEEGRKNCTGCKEWLPFEMFSKNKCEASGLQTKCKKCESIRYKAYYERRKKKNV